MGIEEIKPQQVWRLINMPNRPSIVIQSVDTYGLKVFWHYENEKQINESEASYFLKMFTRVS